MKKQYNFLSPISSSLGFTMIELLVAATIMIVLTTIGLVSYRSINQRARNGKRKADLEQVRSALEQYRVDESTYPQTESFNGMVTTISEYISAQAITDPKNIDPYVYTYSSTDGRDYTVCATLEPDEEGYCLVNP